MQRLLFALLCTLAIVTAHGRNLRQASANGTAPSAPAGAAPPFPMAGAAAPAPGAPAQAGRAPAWPGQQFYSPAPAGANAADNTTFLASIQAANITANVTIMTALLDTMGESRPCAFLPA